MSDETLAAEVKKRSTWTMFMGVLIAALGLVLIAYPFATATITTVFLGWVLILVAIAQVIFALHSHTVGKFFPEDSLCSAPWNLRSCVSFLSH